MSSPSGNISRRRRGNRPAGALVSLLAVVVLVLLAVAGSGEVVGADVYVGVGGGHRADIGSAPLPPASARRVVSRRGSDRGPGTLDKPWRTIQRGLDSLRPGQTLLIRGGTYHENLLMTRAGTQRRPITVRNFPGERAVLRPSDDAEDNMPLQIGSGAAYVRFESLVFEGATGPSTTNVYVWGSAHHIELVDCEVWHSARQGFFSESTTRAIRIVGCSFHDNGGSGPNNLDHNLYVEGRDHVIANCLITGARNGYGIQLYPASNNVLITSNTIVGNRSGIIVGGQGSNGATNAVVVNNILAFNRQYGLTTYWGDGSSGRGNVAENNLAYGNPAGNFSMPGLRSTGNWVGDPRFVRVLKGDYHLRRGSPAIDRALARYAPARDFDGRSRPKGQLPDVGAFELEP